jgi:hypothetical protein
MASVAQSAVWNARPLCYGLITWVHDYPKFEESASGTQLFTPHMAVAGGVSGTKGYSPYVLNSRNYEGLSRPCEYSRELCGQFLSADYDAVTRPQGGVPYDTRSTGGVLDTTNYVATSFYSYLAGDQMYSSATAVDMAGYSHYNSTSSTDAKANCRAWMKCREGVATPCGNVGLLTTPVAIMGAVDLTSRL